MTGRTTAMSRMLMIVFLSVIAGCPITFLVLAITEGVAPTAALGRRVLLSVEDVAVSVFTCLRPDAPEEDIAVLGAVLDAHLVDGHGSRLALSRDTDWPSSATTPASDLVGALANGSTTSALGIATTEAIDDLMAKNRRHLSLCKSPRPDGAFLVGLRLVNELRRQAPNSWESDLREQYEEAFGFLVLSRPGYDHTGRIAVIYAELECGVTCGHGRYYLLERRGSTWSIVGGYEQWVG